MPITHINEIKTHAFSLSMLTYSPFILPEASSMLLALLCVPGADICGLPASWLLAGLGQWEAPTGDQRTGEWEVGYLFSSFPACVSAVLAVGAFCCNYSFSEANLLPGLQLCLGPCTSPWLFTPMSQDVLPSLIGSLNWPTPLCNSSLSTFKFTIWVHHLLPA